nr:MAG TPA: hypothetical protein [Caudoviricetes sp.]
MWNYWMFSSVSFFPQYRRGNKMAYWGRWIEA